MLRDDDATPPLSFVKVDGDGNRNFWAPERAGDYAIDCDLGRSHAEELLVYIRKTENPVIFGSVVRAIAEAGVYGAVEIGFYSRIGIELLGLRPADV